MKSSNEINQELSTDGVTIIENEDLSAWKELQTSLKNTLSIDDLSNIHMDYTSENVNEVRMRSFRNLNAISEWERKYFNMARETISNLIGPDLLIQRKLNLSIQMPEDKSSKLGMHADTLSGQSPFELVMWTAFSDFEPEAGMYYFDIATSKEIFLDMQSSEEQGLEKLREKYWSKKKYLNISNTQVALFTGTIFHGNVTNYTDQTRVSVNCRFKSVYSPEGSEHLSERGVGIFYKLLETSVITKIAQEYVSREVKF